jgi:hypothetical protein
VPRGEGAQAQYAKVPMEDAARTMESRGTHTAAGEWQQSKGIWQGERNGCRWSRKLLAAGVESQGLASGTDKSGPLFAK